MTGFMMRRFLPRQAARRLAMAGLLGFLTAIFAPVGAHVAPDRQIENLDARIAARPWDATLFLKRGEIHRGLSDWKAAAADYRRARELDPALDAVDLCLGRMLVESGRPQEAIPALDRFLAKHPDHPMAIASRARALARLGRSIQAADDFTRAITQSQPHADPDLYLERARALAEGQEPRLDEAIRGLDEGMAALGPLVSLGLYAIDLEVRARRYDAALARIDRLAALSPRKESYLVKRAAILEAAGRPAEARQAYALALEAVAALPPGRRAVPAIEDLASRARAGVDRTAGGSR
jgi:predicted Zn-dependent protease